MPSAGAKTVPIRLELNIAETVGSDAMRLAKSEAPAAVRASDRAGACAIDDDIKRKTGRPDRNCIMTLRQ